MYDIFSEDTLEEELKDNSLAKDLKKISNQLDKILKKEKDLVELRLNESISMDIYQEKYNEISISKEKLLEEKRTLEITLTDEKALKKDLRDLRSYWSLINILKSSIGQYLKV